MLRFFFALILLLLPAACNEETEIAAPSPVRLTAEAVGHYCQMNLLEHTGPKAQVHLAQHDHPVWFSQVRDAIAFLRLPEETAEVTAVFVHDMAKAESWDHPGADNWVDAKKAYFVIESNRKGGMGAPEAIPFSTRDAAYTYMKADGGRIVRLNEISDAYILAPVDLSVAASAQAEGI